MQKIINRFKATLRYLFIRGYRWIWRHSRARDFLLSVEAGYSRLDVYFNTHPTLKRWTKIGGPPFAFFVLFSFAVWIETPGNRELRNIQNQVASEVYSADSVLIGRYFVQDRTEVKYEDITPAVVNALIATEDARFYEHNGVDYRSLGRVLIKSILQQDESSGGGSTLTQQLAKNLYPRKRYWILSMLLNKVKEVRIARKIEDLYSKQQIITLYLNTVPFADNVFGIEAAAKRFYSTSAKNLTVDQAAVLIGMLKATHSYNPRLFPARAIKRRDVVLGQMVKYKFLGKKKAKSLRALPLKLNYNNISHHQGPAPYFREYLKSELLTWCKENEKSDGSQYNLYTDGLKIYTTIDARLQDYAEQATNQQMADIQRSFFDHWGKQKPWNGKEEVLQQAIERSSRYIQLQQHGLSEGDIMEELKKKIPMSFFTWQGEKEVVASPIDSIIHHLQYLNAGFIALEPSTGKVKVWVGGIDHDFFQFDHVKETTKRQVGSIFKPIVSAMALEKGARPCDLLSAERRTYIEKEGTEWTPKNSQDDYKVRYSMKGALAYSVNTIAVKLIEKAGVSNTIALAEKMGITSEMPNVPSIALGSSSISLIEMTTAYACLANEGIPITPYFITTIRDLDGNTFNDFKPKQGPRAMSKETARLINSMLKTVVEEGTASRLRWKYGVMNEVAGKTGTTQSNADGWFMAMTPQLVMGSWVGADDPRIRFRSTELGQGSNTALPIVAYFIKRMSKSNKFKSIAEAKFAPLPPNLQERLDCDLYELNDSLLLKIQRMNVKRDSIIQSDTLATPPPENFLQMLYRRKMRIIKAMRDQDSTRRLEVEILEGDTDNNE